MSARTCQSNCDTCSLEFPRGSILGNLRLIPSVHMHTVTFSFSHSFLISSVLPYSIFHVASQFLVYYSKTLHKTKMHWKHAYLKDLKIGVSVLFQISIQGFRLHANSQEWHIGLSHLAMHLWLIFSLRLLKIWVNCKSLNTKLSKVKLSFYFFWSCTVVRRKSYVCF